MKDRLEWTVYPYKKNKKKTIYGMILVVLLLIFIYFILNSLGWALLAALLLFGSISSYFFPTTYRLGDEGVRVKKFGSKSNYDWDYFKRYEVFEDGIGLLPFAKPSRLDNYRAVFVYFGENNKLEVTNIIKEKVSSATEEQSS